MVQKRVSEKIKPLIPSLREKKRYLSFEIISEKRISFKKASDSILTSFHNLFGSTGESEAGIMMIKNKYDGNKNKGIIRINNKYLDKLRLSLAMIKEIEKSKVIVKSIIASGMIKKAQEAIAG